MDSLAPGDPRKLGSYRLLARLGAGGMGRVYLARSDRGRTVAVKLVHPELAGEESFRQRFRHEVAAARQVGGEWTAPVLDADTEAEIPWVATGYIAGPSLSQVARDFGPLPERSVRVLGAGLARALQAIHAAGIVHRDLKPSNVLITLDGPRVIDFGIARAMDAVTAEGGLTRTGATVGSPGFMSPEQIRGGRITPASDVFCLGSVLAFAATGRTPFGGESADVHAVMYRIAQEEPDLEGVPYALRPLISAFLAKDPAHRPLPEEIAYRTGVEDLLTDLRAAESWLPGGLVTQLGRHAIALLETEDPDADEGVHGGVAAGHPVPGVPGGYAPTAAAPGYGYPHTPTQGHTPPHAYTPTQPHTPPYAHTPTQPHNPPHIHTPPGPHPAPYPAPGGPTPPGSPAYGYPQPPAHQGGPGHQPGPGPSAAPGRRRPQRQQRSRTPLIALAALLVTGLVGGGVALYVMRNDDSSDHRSKGDSGGGNGASSGGSGSHLPGPGAVPQRFLGTWKSSFDTKTGIQTRQLVVTQGPVGAAVAKITGDGTDASGNPYHCVWKATLTKKGSAGAPLRLAPSTVSVGQPMSSCKPGSATALKPLPDGRIRREGDDLRTLVYTRER
ncbi:hypothetical protein ACZ90_51135 [Streptomyces albus subsp. albus]|nr:hypothetical protein ACZ90_51135 [Streptomyces albus subsp. albus]